MLESKSRRRASQRVLLATLWLTILMFVIKVWIGWAAQSLSLLAESLHSLLGAFGTILTLLAIAALAALMPARKAMRIDPLAALRID